MAGITVGWIEDISARAVKKRLVMEGFDWASVQTDGLEVILEGDAPSEARRFNALAAAGAVVEAARVIDNFTIQDKGPLIAPKFSVEILRNDTGISIIGLIPTSSGKKGLVKRISTIADNLPVADWGDSETLEVGEMVWAIGNPYGLDRTLTYGIVSGMGRRGVVGNPYEEFLQTDASINPGNSGGPLVDVHGRVMGITTAIVGKSFRGIGFAIPSTTARRICEEIRQHGRVERGHVGLRLHERPAGGVLIAAVAEQSPASMAGLRSGDVITELDNEYIDSPSMLVLMLTRLPIGNEVTLTVLREDDVIQVPIRIGRRPKE